jgi:23S rRNA G2069 N7-methylase RlmK/C1962 C5-methylase RlmI
LLTSFAVAADTFQTGKVVKWENATYQQKKNKVGQWVVYYVQTDATTYEVARKKETKPKMQPGDTVQLEVKGNKATVINARGHKEQYQVVGQAQAPGQ